MPGIRRLICVADPSNLPTSSTVVQATEAPRRCNSIAAKARLDHFLPHWKPNMRRELVNVEPDGSRWQIRLGERRIQTGLDPAMAIFQATHLAIEHHQSTGMPTGVNVRTLHGEDLLLRSWEVRAG